MIVRKEEMSYEDLSGWVNETVTEESGIDRIADLLDNTGGYVYISGCEQDVLDNQDNGDGGDMRLVLYVVNGGDYFFTTHC